MKFSVSCTVEGVSDIATKTVDTQQNLIPEAILFCERWINKGGGTKGEPWSKKPVILNVVDRNTSALLLGFVVQDELAASMFVVSGCDKAADQAIVQQFRDNCQQAGWSAEHAAHKVPAPGMYLICMPTKQGEIGMNVVKGLEGLGDHLAAAFFNMVGLPV